MPHPPASPHHPGHARWHRHAAVHSAARADSQRRGGARIEALWHLGSSTTLRLALLKQSAVADDSSAVRPDALVRLLGRPTAGSPSTADRGVTPRLGPSLDLGRHGAYALLSRAYRVGGVNFDPPAFTRWRPAVPLDPAAAARALMVPPSDATSTRRPWARAPVPGALPGSHRQVPCASALPAAA